MNISIDWPLVQPVAIPLKFQTLDESAHDISIGGAFDDVPHACPRPHDLAGQRQTTWPDVHEWAQSNELLRIYTQVKQSGLPNMIGARIPVPSQLKTQVWRAIATGHPDDEYVLDGICFGFPLHYTGPALGRPNKAAHASAQNFPQHVSDYVAVETANRAILGPFHTSPFVQWTNISPIMTRPKGDTSKRRIIVDLSYPQGNNVNAFIHKNTLFGTCCEHRLPTVQDTVQAIEERAYRNVPVCPLDLPLLGLNVGGQVYIDSAMPFGARNSSLNMQRIAQFLVRALHARQISCQMYLDDMILHLSDQQDYHAVFREVTALYRALGLPISYSKLQPPADVITYLGITISVPDRTLTIPPKKTKELLELVAWVMKQECVPKKVVQRLVGKMNYVARCVQPARLFMARILMALREAHHIDSVQVGVMRPDLHWFRLFVNKYNGVSIMKPSCPTKIVAADSCLTGGGGTDGTRCYQLTYSQAMTDTHHISTL